MARAGNDPLLRVRKICLGFPDVTERLSHGAPSWFIRDKKNFATLWADGHHGHHFPHLWCAAPPGVQEELIQTEPDRFFRPPYVGGRGWIGVHLDGVVDWDEIGEVCEEAFRSIAPKGLAHKLGKSGP